MKIWQESKYGGSLYGSLRWPWWYHKTHGRRSHKVRQVGHTECIWIHDMDRVTDLFDVKGQIYVCSNGGLWKHRRDRNATIQAVNRAIEDTLLREGSCYYNNNISERSYESWRVDFCWENIWRWKIQLWLQRSLRLALWIKASLTALMTSRVDDHR